MWLGEIDVHDDDEFQQFWEAGRVADTVDRPFAVFWPLPVARVAFRAENNSSEQHALAAKIGNEVVGVCPVMLPLLDNTHVATIEPLVPPQHRGQGIGTALLDAALEVAARASRTTVIAEVSLPLRASGPGESSGSRLLSRFGFTNASLELHRVLDLPAPDGFLEGLAAETAPHHEGYRLVAFGSRVPDELLDGFCALQEAFNAEAPLGELDLEPEVWDEARVREGEARTTRAGRHRSGIIALAPDGEAVALTELVGNAHQPEAAFQSGTLVLPGHRGHRLGLAIKVANQQAFEAACPDARMVHSWNAEGNASMVAINDRLGFRPVEYLSEMQLRLSPGPGGQTS